MQQFKSIIHKVYPFLTGLLLFIVSWQYYQADRKSVIWSDAEGYYIYLPAVFIYDGFEEVPTISGQITPYKDSDKIYTKYTCGVAIMQSPFFLLAQGVSYVAGKDTSGFTSLNNLVIRIAAIFYLVWGIILLRNYLEKRFRPLAVFVAIQALLWGTNLFHYTIREPGMSHVYLFFLFSVFIVFTPRFLQNPSAKNMVRLGLLLGLITLIRPTNCLIVLYLLLYNVYSFNGLLARLKLFLSRFKTLWLVPLMMFVVFIPQFIYWHYISGSFIIYSYNQEGFIYWNDPRILKVLFDVQNGWLLYSPVAVLALAGLVWGIFKRETGFIPVALLIMLFTYIFSSWWAWWFGGAFGHRCFVEFYSFLALPFAYFMHRIFKIKQPVLTSFVLLLIAGLVFYNLRLTHLYVPPWDGDDWTWERYGAVLEEAFYLNAER
ncbi:MAG TPA: hypothetical protein VK927_06870 [Adhaeribacter sp.]|nr:hypothetical protein [Adhaeribacter sp.]